MNYGLYLSAAGIQTSTYRQDVISNNIANAETVGFKKDVPLFQQRLTEAQSRRRGISGPSGPDAAGDPSDMTNPLLEPLGGGHWLAPTAVDLSQGELEPTGNPLDVGIMGPGYLRVSDGQGADHLTRDGRLLVDSTGKLIMANDQRQKLLDVKGKPIQLDPRAGATIDKQGLVTQNGKPVARLGVYAVPQPGLLRKQGNGLFSYPDMGQATAQASGFELRSESVERANVDPATELAALMDTQRQLEANANMIRYQDQALSKAVNEVGKIG